MTENRTDSGSPTGREGKEMTDEEIMKRAMEPLIKRLEQFKNADAIYLEGLAEGNRRAWEKVLKILGKETSPDETKEEK